MVGILPRKQSPPEPDYPVYLQYTSIFRDAKTWLLQQGSSIFEPRQHRWGNSVALAEQLQCLADEHRDILFLSHDVWWNYSNKSKQRTSGHYRLPRVNIQSSFNKNKMAVTTFLTHNLSLLYITKSTGIIFVTYRITSTQDTC